MSRPFADESAYRAIGHPLRRRVLDLLRSGERPVGEMLSAARVPRSTFSQHLRILRTAGLIEQRRRGVLRMYRVQPSQLREIRRWLDAYK